MSDKNKKKITLDLVFFDLPDFVGDAFVGLGVFFCRKWKEIVTLKIYRYNCVTIEICIEEQHKHWINSHTSIVKTRTKTTSTKIYLRFGFLAFA